MRLVQLKFLLGLKMEGGLKMRKEGCVCVDEELLNGQTRNVRKGAIGLAVW